MPVVINEFEVVAEPPSTKASAEKATAAPSPTGASTPAPTPHDIQCIIRHQKERFARVRAH